MSSSAASHTSSRRGLVVSALDADVVHRAAGILGDDERGPAALVGGDAPEDGALLLLDARRTRDRRLELALLEHGLLDRPLDALGVEDLRAARAAAGDSYPRQRDRDIASGSR